MRKPRHEDRKKPGSERSDTPSAPGRGKRRPEERRSNPATAGSRRPEPRPQQHARPHGQEPVAAGAPAEPMRIAKALARAGLCSRRDAERWIADGRVSVNGRILSSPALDVKPGDRIEVDGKPLPSAEPPRLWRYHKPRGLVTTHRDPEGRPTVFDKLPPELPRVVSVGRLDFNTEGLLLLTNDGALARHMELPATGWLRRYRVRAHGRVTQADLDRLKEGVEIEGVRYGPVEATLDTTQGANVWLSIGLREGKNREVRKILATLGLEVNRLIRISFGPFQLAELEPGTVENVKRRVLIDQLGPKLAAELGLLAETSKEPAPRLKPRDRPRRKVAGDSGGEEGA
jgi:23S rRNA pseudouridine2605 synthase